LSTFFASTDVSVRCEANGCAKERATSTSAFATTPPVLLLHLKRFHYDYVTKSYTKRTDRVVVPRTLTLDGFCRPAAVVTAGGAEYRLRCVLGHTGKRAGVGHYIVDVVTWTAANARRWTRHNDSVVHEIAEVLAEREAERQAYILMYIRCDAGGEFEMDRAAAKPSSSASSSSASASATLEDDEDVSSFFSYSCMTEYSNYFYVYYYFICGSRMICSQAAPHQLQVLLTRPQSRSLARAKVRATVRVPALTSRRMLHRSQWTRTRRRFVT
jgi:hypothetical protein